MSEDTNEKKLQLMGGQNCQCSVIFNLILNFETNLDFYLSYLFFKTLYSL